MVTQLNWYTKLNFINDQNSFYLKLSIFKFINYLKYNFTKIFYDCY